MSSTVSEHLQSMFSKLENYISTKTVVGEPSQFGDVIIIPLVEITFFAGSGLKEGKAENENSGGGGLGSRMIPVAVIVIVNGTVQLVNVKNQESVNKLIDMIPGVLAKLNLDSLFSKGKEEEEQAIGSDSV